MLLISLNWCHQNSKTLEEKESLIDFNSIWKMDEDDKMFWKDGWVDTWLNSYLSFFVYE